MKCKPIVTSMLLLCGALFVSSLGAKTTGIDLAPKDASAATVAANRSFAAGRNFASAQEIDFATRGFIATLDQPDIKDANGDVIWQVTPFDAIKGDVPPTVNPSLWESAKLTAKHGLFRLAEGIYQVRNYDIENMTLVAGKTGWIIIDPNTSTEVASASLALANQHLGQRPVTALIYSHSHGDHFGGARGVVNEADVKAGKVRVIAPEGFMENAVSENVLAGNAMLRRAQFQLAMPLDIGPKGAVGSGIGAAMATGAMGLLPPTDVIGKTGQEMMVDGVRIVFQMAPNTEAPSEFLFYFPDLKTLFWAEDVNKTMHNIYTLRGTKARDALNWSKYINELIDLFPDAELAVGAHTWPSWGKDAIQKTLVNQRDMYRFIHDQALYLANQGKKMDDLANATFYPKALQEDFSTRGYYSSLSQNLRGVYNFYLGYYDSNPATLHRYAPAETSTRYVAELGGAKAVLAKGRKAFAAGDYRWTLELVNHLVMADAKDMAARALLADAMEQLGYQRESAVWRNEYLTAAQELRHGVKSMRFSTMGPDMLRALRVSEVFDLLAVRLNHEKADGLKVDIMFNFSDSGESYALELSNSVLNNTKGRVLARPDLSLTLSTSTFLKMTVGKTPMGDLVKAGLIKLEGDPKALGAVFSNVEIPNPLFNVVTQ